jgi:guanylate kinase
LSGVKKGKIIVFSAPSGAGKTTILNHLRTAVPSLVYSVSATTRPPRGNERDGVDYFFMSTDAFRRMIDEGRFAEWQMVHGNYYGTPKDFVDSTVSSGRHLVMDIDVKGKVMFDKSYPGSFGVLILPPSFAELERRLRGRGTDSGATVAVRLGNARAEVAFARERGKYEYEIINDSLDRAQSEVVSIVREIMSKP